MSQETLFIANLVGEVVLSLVGLYIGLAIKGFKKDVDTLKEKIENHEKKIEELNTEVGDMKDNYVSRFEKVYTVVNDSKISVLEQISNLKDYINNIPKRRRR